ncbi:MAG TPA: response regulator [Steroidobacteraceae bacterium]
MATPSPSPEPPSTVIVVEPDILARMVIADYLRGCAYKVIEVSLAEEALTVLRADIQVDVVLCEVKGIGAMDGFSLARQIRQTYPAIDVVLTSGTSTAAEKSHELCEENVVNKPYQPQDIMARINLLREHRRRSKLSRDLP